MLHYNITFIKDTVTLKYIHHDPLKAHKNPLLFVRAITRSKHRPVCTKHADK